MGHSIDPQQDEPPECFEDFFRRRYRWLITLIMAAGGTLEEADDIANETMADISQRWSRIENAEAYARKAAMNRLRKQQKRDREGLLRAVRGGHLSPDSYECSEFTAWEDKQWVDQQLFTLPPAEREVVKAILDGLTVEQVSALFGRTPATIRQRLARARRKLAQIGRDQGHGYDGGDIR